MSDMNKTGKKLTASIVAVIVLACCLCVSTFALIYSTFVVDNNTFGAGKIKINLNDGKPVISEEGISFEPGMTLERDFFIENESTDDVYYRFYFDKVEGGLSEVLEITILNGDTVLFSGKASEMTADTAVAADDTLKIGERRDLTIKFYFPEDSVNVSQKLYLTFDLKADAVQTKNNPDRLFD